MKRSIILIAHNLRSSHNVGSMLRTADGLGLKKVYLTGYTPYPRQQNDHRLPHIYDKLTRQIHKTALGAETTQPWEHQQSVGALIRRLRQQGYTIAALEQLQQAKPLPDYVAPAKIALIVGREVEGIEQEVIDQTDESLYIPMFGKKESFNVVQAAAIAMYHCKFGLLKNPIEVQY